MSKNIADLQSKCYSAEQYILGAILIDQTGEHKAIEKVTSTVRLEMFTARQHALIYRAILDLNGQGKQIDMLEVDALLTDKGVIDEVGGLAYLADLMKNCSSARNVKAFCDRLVESYVSYETAKLSTEFAKGKIEHSVFIKRVSEISSLKAGNDAVKVIDSDQPTNETNIYQHASNNDLFRLAKSLSEAAQFPLQTATLTTLSIMSSVASTAYTVMYPDGSPLNLGLYIAVEQPPAAAKSRVLNVARNPIQEAFKRVYSDMEQSISKHSEVDGDGKTPEQAAEEIEELPILPPMPIPYATNATSAALDGVLLSNGGWFNIASAEQGAVTSVLGSNHEGANDNDLMLMAFTGTDYYNSQRATRKGFNGMPWGSCTVIAQNGTINNIIEGSNGQGLAERFLMMAEPSMLGRRNHRLRKSIDSELLRKYESVVTNMVSIYYERNPKKVADLKRLQIAPSGWDLIMDYREGIEPMLADGERYSHDILRGAFGKADMQIMKIAALLHLASGQTDAKQIDNENVKSAIRIVNELLVGLYGIMEAKGMVGLKAEYVSILSVFEKHKERTERQLTQAKRLTVPFKNMTKPTDAVKDAIGQMVSAGILKRMTSRDGVEVLVVC